MGYLKILFDLQEYLIDKPLGELSGDEVLCPFGDTFPALFVEQVEDTRVVRVGNRVSSDAGVEIMLKSIERIVSGDRFTVVGRFGQSPSLHGVKIALFSMGDKDVELACHEPFKNLYSLSCKLTDITDAGLFLSFSKTSKPFTGIDFFVDGILIVREKH